MNKTRYITHTHGVQGYHQPMIVPALLILLSLSLLGCRNETQSSIKPAGEIVDIVATNSSANGEHSRMDDHHNAEVSIASKVKPPMSRFPIAQTWKTKEGLKVWFLHDSSLPIVDMQLTFKAGSVQPAVFAGLSRLTNALIGHGTKELSEAELNLQFDNLGTDLSLSSHRDMAVVGIRTLAGENWHRSTHIMTKMLAAPAFPPSGLERLVANHRLRLVKNKKLPSHVVSKAFWSNLYSEHAYSQPVDGTLESLSQIKPRHLRQFYQTYYVASNGVLAIVGDVSHEEAQKKAALISQYLPATSIPLPKPSLAKGLSTSMRKHIEVNSQQTHIRIGHLTLPRLHADYMGLYVANQVLGGGALTSVLGHAIREKRGWAYSVGSYMQPMLFGGPWTIYMQTANQTAEAAITKTLSIVNNFAHHLTDQRIDEAVQYLRGNFALNTDSNRDLLGYLSMMAFYDLPVNYLNIVDEKLAQITPEKVRSAWQKHFHQDKLLIVSAGKRVAQSTSTIERAIQTPPNTRQH